MLSQIRHSFIHSYTSKISIFSLSSYILLKHQFKKTISMCVHNGNYPENLYTNLKCISAVFSETLKNYFFDFENLPISNCIFAIKGR